MAAFDPDCEIPSPDLLPARTHRPVPYLYSPEEIAALVHAAGTIAAPLHAATMHTVICLITASGMRLGETLGLDRRDVDLVEAMLTVTGKNGHTRLVPLHPSTAGMLDDYAQRRDRLCPGQQSAAFFITPYRASRAAIGVGRRTVAHQSARAPRGWFACAGLGLCPRR